MKKMLLATAFAAAALSAAAFDVSAATPQVKLFSTRQVNLFCDANYTSVERGKSGILVRNDSDITIPKGAIITLRVPTGLLGKGKAKYRTVNEVAYQLINAHGGVQTFLNYNVRNCTATATIRLFHHS